MLYRLSPLLLLVGVLPGVLLGVLGWQLPAQAEGEWTGIVSGEGRWFANQPLDAQQADNNASFAMQPEYTLSWENGYQIFEFTGFARWDSADEQRTHADIRELAWIKAAESWEFRAGIRKVFWGVTESQHLVDIINQTDLVEATDGEEKLGQPMLNLALIRSWGTLDLFVLPGFRERSFPGEEGRLRTIPYVDTDHPLYQADNEDRHIDYAARYFHYIGEWDFGLSYFAGTSRDPRFVPAMDNGDPVLRPYYDLIRQWGLEVQTIRGEWLWKLETIHRSGQGDTYNAATAGFEYTFIGVMASATDVGLISEYLFDSRGDEALTPFARDVMIGSRITLNDAQSTEILIGVIIGTDNDNRVFTLESSRRLGDAWKLALEGQAFAGIKSGELLYGVSEDDYLKLTLERYF